jgi:hypothetical protein
MRIWSLHPHYLDGKGLTALWREALLAKKVLEGKTIGYKNHPQLERFKRAPKPLDAINQFLADVYLEAVDRGYAFNRKKIDWGFTPITLTVTDGQLIYETTHLVSKLKMRDQERFDAVCNLKRLKTHPMFKMVKGDVEKWEVGIWKHRPS